jgi:PncC family amidohydrolase
VPEPGGDVVAVLDLLGERGQTLAVAESLTGGMLAAAITSVAGASAVFRGAVVAYATDLKVGLLDVPDAAVQRVGVVSAEVARAMAEGARRRCGATWAVSTTGVAGPDEQEGKPVGTVYVGWSGPSDSGSARLALHGRRSEIREATCVHALSSLRRRLEAVEGSGEEQPMS